MAERLTRENLNLEALWRIHTEGPPAGGSLCRICGIPYERCPVQRLRIYIEALEQELAQAHAETAEKEER